jgi:rod shape-determining protein MreD
MRGAFIFFLTLLLLQALVAAANHSLAQAGVFLFVGGLFVGTAAFVLPFGPGFAAVFAAGLACDANADVPFGTHALLFSAAHSVLFHLRDRLPHDETVGCVLIGLVCNLALFIVLTVLRIHQSPAPAVEWSRAACDLVLSQIVIALAAPWFFALQKSALVLAHAGSARPIF